ncbi:MAG: amidohydrolase family protein [Acidobacteria bacterium]|nr:amidohydrolase family protein [Acidobacteriota bacterium]
MQTRRWAVAVLIVLAVTGPAASVHPQETYDVVLAGGTVMDPETGLNAVRYVGIRGDRIVAVSEEPLAGSDVIDVTGLIVAPGFIDMHAHGQTYEANVFQAHDGVTTALELEGGVGDVAAFLEGREGSALVNYGASVAHSQLRIGAMPKYEEVLAAVGSGSIAEEGELQEMFALLNQAGREPVDSANYGVMKSLMHANLEAGGLGLGVPHQYYPGANYDEIFRVFEMAAEWYVPIYTHVRDMTISAFQEVLANAAATGAPLHIVHINSMSLGNIGTTLDLIQGAMENGVDVSAEAYPYTAASTGIGSAIFDDGWQEKLGISYGDVQWQDTGERLTAETFAQYRETGGTVIIHMMKPEWVEMWLQAPFVMIASDGMPYAPGAHPRSAGTFTRVLGRYAREQEMLPLMEAVSRMSFMPAQRLERFAPSMARKGRIQPGADADITVFDPGRVIDTATFEDDLSKSEGVRFVLVNGEFVVREGATVEGVAPGRPVLGRLYRESR